MKHIFFDDSSTPLVMSCAFLHAFSKMCVQAISQLVNHFETFTELYPSRSGFDDPTGVSITRLIKLDPLSTSRLNHATSISSPLLLVLLLRKVFTFRHDEILVRTFCVIIWNVGV